MEIRRLKLFEAVGVEIEYMIVGAETLDVYPVADRLIEAAAGERSNDYEKEGISWSNELALHLVELKTTDPAHDLAACVPLFQSDVNRIEGILKGMDARLLPTGNHPWMDPARETRLWPHDCSEIYRTFDRIFDCSRHGWGNLQSVHINLPFSSDEEFGRLHAAVRVLLPIIPALAASTPFAEGKNTGFLDYRMEAYRNNASKVPSIAGDIIPEPIYCRADYSGRIFSRIFDDIRPHDPDGVLIGEWLNSRGAIARFDRMSIEIRVVDVQECPAADLAVVWAIVSALKALTEERWSPLSIQKEWETVKLKEILLGTIRFGEKSVITSAPFLELFGLKEQELTAGALWRHIIERSAALYGMPAPFAAPLDSIFGKGTLASRIVNAAGDNPSRAKLRALYGDLAQCLSTGSLFGA